MAEGKQVLFISRQRLVGAVNGSSTYLIDLARAVRRAGMTPHLIQPSPTVAGRWPVLRLRPEMRVFETHRIRGLVRIGEAFVTTSSATYRAIGLALIASAARRLGAQGSWASDRPLPYAVALPWSRADHAFLRRHARGCADIAVADYMFCVPGFDDLPDKKAPTAIVMHDLFHARTGGLADSVAAIGRDEEIALLARADAVVAIQADEARFVTEHVAGSRAILAPMAAVPAAAAQPGRDDLLLFVGSNTAPNVVGLEWFFREVWPRLQFARPGIELRIAGTIARAFPSGGPAGVRFLGLVDDLEALYAEAGIVVSPLTFGSGLKIKLVEAMAKGKAIVATGVTLQGVRETVAACVVEADDPAAFADAVARLAGDAVARKALALAALDRAAIQFSPAHCYAAFVDWLQQAVGDRASRVRPSAPRTPSAPDRV